MYITKQHFGRLFNLYDFILKFTNTLNSARYKTPNPNCDIPAGFPNDATHPLVATGWTSSPAPTQQPARKNSCLSVAAVIDTLGARWSARAPSARSCLRASRRTSPCPAGRCRPVGRAVVPRVSTAPSRPRPLGSAQMLKWAEIAADQCPKSQEMEKRRVGCTPPAPRIWVGAGPKATMLC